MGIVSVIMRFVFYSFLVLNVVYFGWKVLESAGEVPVVVPVSETEFESSDHKIVLLSEKDLLIPSASLYNARDKMSLCTAVGPFGALKLAKGFLGSLQKEGYKAEIQEVAVKTDSIHWVYLAPYPSMEQALQKLAELQARKIDSYVVTEGEFQYGISLGYFSKEDSAIGLKAKLDSAGLPASIQEQQRHKVELWVAIHPESEEKDGGALIKRLLEGTKYRSTQKTLCDFSSLL